MACKTVRYANLTDKPIRFVKGLSGVPWPGCDSEPGGIVEIPEGTGYARLAAEAGYTLVTPELQATLDEDAKLKAMLAEDAAKADAEASKPAETPISPLTEAEQSTKGSNSRGRSNRSANR